MKTTTYKIYLLFALLMSTFITMSFNQEAESRLKFGLYYGYTENEFISKDSTGHFVKTRTKVPSELQINEDGTFSLLHKDVSFMRPSPPTDFYAAGTWRISSDTLKLNSKYLNKDFITVIEKTIDNCNENFMRFRVSYGFDTLENRIYPNVSMKLNRSTVEFEDNQYYYYRKERLNTLKLSRRNITIMNWVYPIRNTSSNSFDISLKLKIEKQNIIIEEEKFIIQDSALIPLNYETMYIDKFKHINRY